MAQSMSFVIFKAGTTGSISEFIACQCSHNVGELQERRVCQQRSCQVMWISIASEALVVSFGSRLLLNPCGPSSVFISLRQAHAFQILDLGVESY